MTTQTTHLTALALDAARLAGAFAELSTRRPEVSAHMVEALVGGYHGGADNFEAEAAS